MDLNLSRLTPIAVRDVWRHEAYDFTTWLLSNADVLSEILGMELELTRAEHQVGGFSLDLIGHDLTTGRVVIVENQLEQTDHGHLGQLLTYAGGTDPATIVWCAPSFREEHRAALDWLNEHTDEDTRFFGVEVAAVRIDDSRPAPLFRLIAKPNDWSKQLHKERSSPSSEREMLYFDFWNSLLGEIRVQHPDWTKALTGSKSSWITLPYGTSTIWYGFTFTRTGPIVELYFGAPNADVNTSEFEKFLAHRSTLDLQMGRTLVFDPLPGKKACRIYYPRPEGGVITDLAQHEIFIDWFIDVFAQFRAATQHVKSLLETTGPSLPPA